ncbi:uncharacterized protein [Amphiura filiformis]|uniref:uncharacterized protein n=1 Tax=Amphiura filiformis TaxID=82378 RepID=UPI003B210377
MNENHFPFPTSEERRRWRIQEQRAQINQRRREMRPRRFGPNPPTVQDLRKQARDAGLRGYSRLRKAELVQFLRNNYAIEREPAQELFDLEQEPFDYPIDWVPVHPDPELLRQEQELFDLDQEPIECAIDRRLVHPAPELLHPEHEFFDLLEIEESASALRRFAIQYTVPGLPGFTPETFLQEARGLVLGVLVENRGIKAKTILRCWMVKTNLETGEEVRKEAAFHSEQTIILEATDLDEVYDTWSARILENISTFINRGSGWAYESTQSLDLHTVEYEPLGGSSYIPLPEFLAKKKAIVNLKNEDDACFKWAVTRATHMVGVHLERIEALREKAAELNWDGVKFPTPLSGIGKFERRNPTISVNVHGFDGKKVYPLRISDRDCQREVDLLLISDKKKQHYCVVKSLSRLLSTQVSKKGHARHFCRRCYASYTSKERLVAHTDLCRLHESVRIEMPEKGSVQEFKNHFRSQNVSFVVYADFESFTKPIHTRQPDPNGSYTQKYQKHDPSGFCYYIKCFDDSLYRQGPVMYAKRSEEEDVAQIFVERLEEDIRRIYRRFKLPQEMIPDQRERAIFAESSDCHICKKPLTPRDEENRTVRDHCHFTGKFRGAAHNKCNLRYRKPKFFPVIFHNLAGYDAHLFVKNLGKTEGKIDCIPNNEEKYISFTKQIVVDSFVNEEGKEVEVKRDLRFIDSFKFMASSLSKLVDNLSNFPTMGKFFPSEEKRRLLVRKGVYPYDHVDSLKKLEETRLPSKAAFYSRLNEENISDEDYEHAQKVWEGFEMKTFREYHDLYLESDVLLLADVFESFREVCQKNYELDPAWYFTAPGLAYDAMLKKTGARLELLNDVDMMQMIEKGIRGGVSMISTRHSEANNKYMGSDFDPTKPSKFIQYLDANNLYGHAMSQPLPTGGFKWMTASELRDWRLWPCIVEVDLEYPNELHDLHNDYPLAPERLVIGKVEKLVPNLRGKKKYVIHCAALKQYLSLGLRLEKIHRGIRFEESAFMKEYIDLNTRLRKEAANEFEKDFFKLMNNSVFGKTMENIRNRVDIHLVNSRKKAKKLAAKPNFERRTILTKT